MGIGSEQERQRIFGSLSAVGKAKPLGYLPLATLDQHLEMEVGGIAASLEKRSLKTKILQADECCIKSGALHVYDPSALQNVLDVASDVLEDNAWPTVAELFVNHIARNWIEQTHPVCKVIERAFGQLQ